MPILDETRFLVAAAAKAPAPRARAPRRARKNFDERVAWLIDLFVRLGERQQLES
jgi:hypothetical protein